MTWEGAQTFSTFRLGLGAMTLCINVTGAVPTLYSQKVCLYMANYENGWLEGLQ